MTTAVLLLVAVPLFFYSYHSVHESNPAAATTQTPAKPASQQKKPAAAPQTAVSDPVLRLDLLRASEKIAYSGGSRNIFRVAEVKIQPPKESVRNSPPPVPVNPLPPPPPPINLKFYGFANKPGEPRQVFLSQGDDPSKDLFLAREGDIVNRRYKIVQIKANAVVVQDLLTNNQQTIQITAG